jgi:hypothetical protein
MARRRTETRTRTEGTTAQAWVELLSDDPEAISALTVARAHLAAGRGLRSLRRLRLFEITGPLPPLVELEDLLHRSIQFYNPHKERCIVRTAASEPAPLRPDEQAALVFERDGARRGAAERWWRHETGVAVEVREGNAWLFAFDGAAHGAEDLTVVRDRRHGLLCNPHAQECRWTRDAVPLPWITEEEAGRRSHRR